jgi:hypothetical protein
MAEAPPDPPQIPADRARAEREARLAAALRANLRRRKAQARGREEAPAAPPDPPRDPDDKAG